MYWPPEMVDEYSKRQAVRLAGNVPPREGFESVFMRKDGNICFVSREDDMIKSSGYRIGPAEVEEALEKHPAIAEAGVVGVPEIGRAHV